MAGDWLGVGGKWSGPKRGNTGSRGDRQAQRKREAAKRRAARATARAAREAAGEVAGKRGPKAKTSWRKRRLIGKQTPLGRHARATVAFAQMQQARQHEKEAAAKAAALELEKEAALQDARAAAMIGCRRGVEVGKGNWTKTPPSWS